MGIETISKIVVISTQTEIARLHGILASLPVDDSTGKKRKAFRDNAEYKNRTQPIDDGVFNMSDVVMGEAKQLDSKLDGYWFLYITSSGWNCEWEPDIFLSANGIEYVMRIESSWHESEPYAERISMTDDLTQHEESVSLVGDYPSIANDPRYGQKPSEFISFGRKLLDKAGELCSEKETQDNKENQNENK